MSANVRRLVLDPAPVLQSWVGYGMWLFIAAFAALWMSGHAASNPMMIFSVSVVTVNFVVKVKTWEILPVSRWELGRAQWWYLLGRPCLLALLTAALAAGIDAAFGWLRVGTMDIVAFLGSELALLVLIGGAVPLGAGLSTVLGVAGNLAAYAVFYPAALALAFHWSEKAGFAALRPEMLTGGMVAVAVTAVAYLLTPWIPLARNQVFNRPPAQTLPAPRAASDRPAATRGSRSPHGAWAVFAPLFNRGLRGIVMCAAAACALAVPRLRDIVAQAVPPDVLLFFLPLLGGIIAMTLTTIAPQRVLASLPLSAFGRTVALLAVSPALQLPLAGITFVMANAMTAGHPGPWWLPQLGLSVLGGLALAALALPMTLRFGQKGPTMMILAWIPLGVVSGVVTALTMKGKDHGLLMLSVVVTLVVLMLLSWWWTWWEIAYGRAIYRQWTWQPVSWRGQ